MGMNSNFLSPSKCVCCSFVQNYETMKQLLIGLFIGIVGALVISVFSTVAFKTLGGVLLLIAIGMGMFGIADIIYHQRHGDLPTDPFSNKKHQRKL